MTADHSARLDRHDMDIRELREGQSAIIQKLDKQDNVLGVITNSLTEMRAQKGPSWHQLISTGTQVVFVIGAIVSGIVYIASNGQSPALQAIDHKVSRLEWRMDQNDAGDKHTRTWIERADGVIKRLEFASGWKATTQRD